MGVEVMGLRGFLCGRTYLRSSTQAHRGGGIRMKVSGLDNGGEVLAMGVDLQPIELG